jgi:hypothetical protein
MEDPACLARLAGASVIAIGYKKREHVFAGNVHCSVLYLSISSS